MISLHKPIGIQTSFLITIHIFDYYEVRAFLLKATNNTVELDIYEEF